MPKSPLTAEAMWKMPRVGAPVPSPDGSRALVPVTTYDLEADEGTTRLWLVPSDAEKAGAGGNDDPARPLTTAEASSGQPAWSPDGTRILFIRKPGGEKKKGGPEHTDVPQLFVMPVDGGEPERLTDLPFGAADPRWFPDGRRIAFLSQVYEAAPTLEETAKRKAERDEDPVKAHVTENRFYRYWDHWLTERTFHHVFVRDLESGAQIDLTPDCWRITGLMDPSQVFFVAPDGKEVAFSGVKSEPPYDTLVSGVYRVRVPVRIREGTKAPKVRELSRGHDGNAFRPVYSPDGRFLVYGINYETDFYADRVRLVAYDRESREKTVLTEEWDHSAGGWIFDDSGKTVYLLAETEARSAAWALDLRKAVRKPAAHPPREVARGGTLSGLRFAGRRLFTNISWLTAAPEAWVVDTRTEEVRRLTGFTAEAMRDVELSKVVEMTFTGADNDPVRMFVLLPPGEKMPKRGERRRKRWPLVHMIHGGPHGVFGDQWHWRWNAQAFAAPGYAVALVNFHGSTSFGEHYTASILGRWGDQPYKDINAATDHLLKLGIVNRNRMAVTGGSYGGYLVSWIASQTKRYACIVNHAGVCDFQTQYASDVTHGRARSMGGEPWDRLDGLDKYNPMRHAEGFRTPMLVIHGVKDYRVPYNQGLEIYNVYKAKGLPARLVVYPDENHWILKPKNSLHWYGEVLGWLARWLSR